MASVVYEKSTAGATVTVRSAQVPNQASTESIMSGSSILTAYTTTEKAATAPDSAGPRPSGASDAPVNPFDTDIEAMISRGLSETSSAGFKSSSALTRIGAPTDCQVWPGKDHWRRKAQAAKRSRANCTCMAGLSKRNRIILKVLIGLLIIGIAVGVGVGISKPLGAGIWHQSNNAT